MAARARLQGETVLVPDEKDGSTLYNKGFFGVPRSGGGLMLDLTEALYLVEHNRLSVEGEDSASLLRHASRLEPDFEIRYVVYRDLRARGFVVKPSNVTDTAVQEHGLSKTRRVFDYNVYDRGAVPGRSPSKSLVRCATERGALQPAAVLDEVERARKHRKTLLVALVDEEGDLTYYEAKDARLQADVRALPDAPATATLLADRVAVLDPREAERLFAQGYFGRDVGLALQLSLPEALYLAEHDRLRVVEADGATPVPPEELARRARRVEPDFDLRHALYRHLRARGVVVKTGFKYGTHFRAYAGAPEEEHAPYLVHAVAPGRGIPWPEVAGFVRLAHGVRKRFFFAVPGEGGEFRLLELTRRKP